MANLSYPFGMTQQQFQQALAMGGGGGPSMPAVYGGATPNDPYGNLAAQNYGIGTDDQGLNSPNYNGTNAPYPIQGSFNPVPQGSGATPMPKTGTAPTAGTQQPFQFPQFNMPGFPYANLPQQLAASFTPPGGQFSNGSQYGRWNGVNNNAFGLFPNQFQPLFGTTPGGTQMPFQPPWGNNGSLGSNQGPGANPGAAAGQMPQLPSSPMPKLGAPDVTTQSQPPGLLSGSNGVTFSGGNYQAPSIPTNATPDNTAYSSRFMPTGANVQSAELQHALASGRLTGSYAQNLANMPQSFTPAQFNQVAQQNPVLAEQMAAQGGQGYMNGIMAQNGWSPQQMNNFINAYGTSATPGFNPQAMQLLNSLGIR